MNNYEKIKNFSIEEMVEFMKELSVESLCHYCKGCDNEDLEIGCTNGIKQWLETESEE